MRYKLTINFIDGSKNFLPIDKKEIFDSFVEFFMDERKTNLTLQTNNGFVLYPKDKILYVSCIEDKESIK